MKIFLKRVFKFFAIGLSMLIAGITILLLFFPNDIPAPNFSDSYSYNDKISFIRGKEAKILSIGSSMTLINLESGSVTDYFKTRSYLNLSSWGMNMKDIYSLLQIYCRTQSKKKDEKNKMPALLLVNSNLLDFFAANKNINVDFIEDYLLQNKSRTLFHTIKIFKIPYYRDNWKFKKLYKASSRNYQSLVYDKYGGVLLDKGITVPIEKWNVFPNTPGTAANYLYLDSISEYCRNNQMSLVFFQSPVRKGLLKTIDAKVLGNHIKKIETILAKNINNVFVNSGDTIWSDSLFIDAIHLNREGAGLFTKYCLRKIPKQINILDVK